MNIHADADISTISETLCSEFRNRRDRNPNYSMRAFAKFLRIHPRSLSQIMSGERSPTDEFVDRMMVSLNIDPQKINLESVQKKSSLKENINLRKFELDQYDLISDWLYDAILVCMGNKQNSQSTAYSAKEIAKKIHQPEVLIKDSLKRLLRLGFIKATEDGSSFYKISGTQIKIKDKSLSTIASRNYQRKLLEKSLISVDDVSPERRGYTSSVFSLKRKDYLRIRKKMKDFTEDLASSLQQTSVDKTKSSMEGDELIEEIYCMQMSLFPVNHLRSKK